MVGDIEGFGQELQMVLLCQGEVPADTNVEVNQARADVHVAANLRRASAGAAAGVGDFTAGHAVVDTAAGETADGRK